MLHSSLLHDNVQLAIDDRVVILNSAADPFVLEAAQRLSAGELILAEDNIASLQLTYSALKREFARIQFRVKHVPFHEYTLHEASATIDIAIMNMVYQPSNAWMIYALQIAVYALKPGGRLYVVGAKDRGVLSIAKRMHSFFGNLETLVISKGQRVVCSRVENNTRALRPQGMPLHVKATADTQNVVGVPTSPETVPLAGTMPTIHLPTAFAEGKLDEGTNLLLEALEVNTTDIALDIGCGAGFIGIHIAHLASKGQVTMVDASLASVDAARRKVEESGITNAQVLASDGTQEVKAQRFDLVVTNPPFHLGGKHTTAIAERFIREAAQVLRPRGRFYLVANRFLKYEPTLLACFQSVGEVGGNTRYKVLLATNAIILRQ